MGTRIEYDYGHRFPQTQLSYVKEVERQRPKHRRAIFQCDCGRQCEADIAWVTSRNTTSCGCWRSSVTASKNAVHGQAVRGEMTGAYRSWTAMHQRCKVDPHYVGIEICDRWNSFENFYEDMGDRPNGYTIERTNNAKGYTPTNCIWADQFTQTQNSANAVKVTIAGETHTINEWCRIKGIGYHVVKQRRQRGMSLEDAITHPLNKTKQGRKS